MLPIRILHVVTHMNRGGLETMLMDYYRNIDRTKVQFDFLVHRDCTSAYDNEILNLGGKIYHLPLLNPFSITYRKELNCFFKKHPEYQIVHVHQDCMSSIILKAALKNGVKIRIAHSHCASQDKNLKYIIKMFYRHFIPKYATHLFACGKKAGDWMFRGADFSVINNAINTKNFIYDIEARRKIRNEFGVDSNEILLGHVGRFSPPKKHDYLINIFSEFLKNTPAKLILVGDGSLKNKIEEQIKSLNIESNVIFAGIRTDVNKILSAMDVFVFPSQYEGLPVTLVEAQTSGLPCVISANITDECIFANDLVKKVSLDKSYEQWCTAINSFLNNDRIERSSLIDDAGYEIKSAANKLLDFYINCEKSGDI